MNRLLAFLPSHPLRDALLALMAVSIVGCAGVVLRSFLAGHKVHLFLIWNLFLAWLPLLFVLAIEEGYRRQRLRGWSFAAAFGAWMLLLPNAPYILTDLVHLQRSAPRHWWTDLTLILWFSLVGLLLGFLALRRMQKVLGSFLSERMAITATLALIPLSAFGIYIGRFERWNSWDVVVRPLALIGDIPNWFHWHAIKFTALFSLLLGAVHLMLTTTVSLMTLRSETTHES